MKLTLTGEQVCQELGINYDEVVNIYPYGSRVYGSNNNDSDYDYIIVFKASRLKSGAFKDNAISSRDRLIQGTCYSRGGFQDAVNKYNINALECLSLSDDKVLKNKWAFKITRYSEQELVKSVITQASNSWYLANNRYKLTTSNKEVILDPVTDKLVRKGIWHSLRILMFGIQYKTNGKIIDFGAANILLANMLADKDFKPRNYIRLRDQMIERMRV